jgi:hypothetical protein
MSFKPIAVLLALAATAGLVLLVPAGRAVGQEIQQVFVTNFPKVFRVEGSVQVPAPIPHASLVRFTGVLVSPVSPKDTLRLVPGGTLATDGFTSASLSLNGETKGEVYRAGTVGAILIPDEESIVRAFEEKGQLQFSLEVTAASGSGRSGYFASVPVQHPIGFPRYRIFFYNTADKTVSVNLFAYLTH